MSQLLKRLRGELLTTTGLNSRVELMAMIACNLARQGKFAEAKATVVQAREWLAASGTIGTVWIMLAEGLILFFEQQSPQALDRIARAQALGLALRYSKLIALASAWKAHIEFDHSKYVEMVASLSLAQQHATAHDQDAQTRLALVVFSAFAFCGDTNQAQKWFLKAHDHAVKNGDQASLESLMYNRAALAYTRLRVDSCISQDASALARLKMEISSSNNLNHLVGSAALINHAHLFNARLLILEHKYREAAVQIQSIRYCSPFATYHIDQAYVDLELCYCNFRLGQADLVSAYLDGGHPRQFPGLDIDEQIVALWMLWQMSVGDPRFGDAPGLHAQFDALCSGYTRSRAGLLESLRPFVQ